MKIKNIQKKVLITFCIYLYIYFYYLFVTYIKHWFFIYFLPFRDTSCHTLSNEREGHLTFRISTKTKRRSNVWENGWKISVNYRVEPGLGRGGKVFVTWHCSRVLLVLNINNPPSAVRWIARKTTLLIISAAWFHHFDGTRQPEINH